MPDPLRHRWPSASIADGLRPKLTTCPYRYGRDEQLQQRNAVS
jgi:hypothetical protein